MKAIIYDPPVEEDVTILGFVYADRDSEMMRGQRHGVLAIVADRRGYIRTIELSKVMYVDEPRN